MRAYYIVVTAMAVLCAVASARAATVRNSFVLTGPGAKFTIPMPAAGVPISVLFSFSPPVSIEDGSCKHNSQLQLGSFFQDKSSGVVSWQFSEFSSFSGSITQVSQENLVSSFCGNTIKLIANPGTATTKGSVTIIQDANSVLPPFSANYVFNMTY